MHICQFYQSRKELTETLVPYFTAGLENNEHCVWITSEPLVESEATSELAKSLPKLRRYLNSGQLEIIPHTDWYLKDGIFDRSAIINRMAKRLEVIRKHNYDGMRIAGNANWIDQRDWRKVIQYEHEVNINVGDYQALAICAYPIVMSGFSQLLDVIDEHEFAIIKRGEKWVQLGSLDKRSKVSEDYAASLVHNVPDPMMIINPDTSIRYINPAFETLTGFLSSELVGQKVPYPWWPDKTLVRHNRSFVKSLQKELRGFQVQIRKKDGEQRWVEINSVPVEGQGRLAHCLSVWADITKHKQIQQYTETYAAKITKAHEAELKRIAQKLHEDTAQSLAALCLETDAIMRAKEPQSEKTTNSLKRLRTNIAKIQEEVRSLSYQLRPGELDILGWKAACELLIAELNKKGVYSDLVISGVERHLAPEMAMLLFRIVQEALKNIVKHAQSTKVSVNIHFYSNKVKVAVSDNGRGFEANTLVDFANQGKIGLLSIQEQVRLCGGAFSITSGRYKGTKLKIILKT